MKGWNWLRAGTQTSSESCPEFRWSMRQSQLKDASPLKALIGYTAAIRNNTILTVAEQA